MILKLGITNEIFNVYHDMEAKFIHEICFTLEIYKDIVLSGMIFSISYYNKMIFR